MLGLFALVQTSQAQRFTLFSPQVKADYPSVVYDFLERYLYEIDSLQLKGEYVDLRIRDDKVMFVEGNASDARRINTETHFEIKRFENKYYEVVWTDNDGHAILDVAFPMQYELLLGKPKVDIEKEFHSTVKEYTNYKPVPTPNGELVITNDSCLVSNPVANYYIESLNTATYYNLTNTGDTVPTFTEDDNWHSAANLLLGVINEIEGYSINIEQRLYGFKKEQFTITLQQWLAYCQAMQLKCYFAVEEERTEGLRVLLIAQSVDLGFNHMLSLIIPADFVTDRNAQFHAVLNAYIPTQNVKDLYQKYVAKPKKKI